MIWYYTNADPAFGFRQAKDLHQHLDRMLIAMPLEAVFLRTRKCIVIRPMNSNTQRLTQIALKISSSDVSVVEEVAMEVKTEVEGETQGDLKLETQAAGNVETMDSTVPPVAAVSNFSDIGSVGANSTLDSTLSTKKLLNGATKLTLQNPSGHFGIGSQVVAKALQDPNCLVMCACCDAISQRTLIPLSGERIKNIDKLSKLYTISVGKKISRAKYFVEDHVTLLNTLKDVLDKVGSI